MHIYWVITDSVSGLLPVRHQAMINWASNDLLNKQAICKGASTLLVVEYVFMLYLLFMHMWLRLGVDPNTYILFA